MSKNIPLLEKEGWPTASGLAAGVVSSATLLNFAALTTPSARNNVASRLHY
jgi:hypothetical protein